MTSLDDALALEAVGPNRWKAYADPDHESINATSGQQARLWSAGRALLATTEQLAWYR